MQQLVDKVALACTPEVLNIGYRIQVCFYRCLLLGSKWDYG